MKGEGPRSYSALSRPLVCIRSATFTLDLYSHVTPSLQKEAADRLGQSLRGPLAGLKVAVRDGQTGQKPDKRLGRLEATK
jgi:hypothetical protein